MGHYNISFIILSLVTGGFIALLALRLVTLINVARAKEKNALLSLSTLMLGSSVWLLQVLHGLAFPLIEKTGFSLTLALVAWVFSAIFAGVILLCASQASIKKYAFLLGSVVAGLAMNALFYIHILSMQISPAVQFSISKLFFTVPIIFILVASCLYFLFQFKFNAHLYRFRQKLWIAVSASVAILSAQCLFDQAIILSKEANSAFPINSDSLLIGFKIGLGFICLFIMPFIIAIFYDKFRFNTFLWRHLTHPKFEKNDTNQSVNKNYLEEVKQQVDQDILAEELLEIFSYDALNLEYQIKVDSQTRMPVGAEAFLRWAHPVKGSLTPAEFMPLAEKLDMRDDIDAWVIEESCRMLHRLKNAHIKLPICVNLSRSQLEQPALVEHITSLLKRFDLDASQIIFEIPESLAFNEGALLNSQLAQLKALNIQVAIDDFGTQSSTLSQLQNLPVYALKLGPALTKDIEFNDKTRSVAQAVIDLAHALGLKVVAENVETEGQRKCLSELNCDQMQGFIISPPLPEHRFLVLLKNLQLN